MKTYKAIIQLTSAHPTIHLSIIRSINNLLDHLKENVEVRIICHGSSVAFCLHENNALRAEIRKLLSGRVSIAACRNMLIANAAEPDQLIEDIEIIPSGIAELVILQQEGWSYVKAG